MSARELSRVEVLSRVKAGTLSLGSAATMLAVSYRQAKRLARQYRAEGAKGLKHRGAGGRVESSAADGRPQAGAGARPEEVQRAGGRAVWPDAGRRAPGERRRRHGGSRYVAAVDDGGGVWSRARKRAPHRQRRGAEVPFRRPGTARWEFSLVVRDARPARLSDEPGRRCDRPDARAARGSGNDLGGG
jgi:hypothetical protein